MTTPDAEWGIEALDLEGYFRRIGYSGPRTSTMPTNTLKTLGELHRAHVLAIPFENLELLLGGMNPLDLESLQNKLVRRSRGGYCNEHTLLFAAVLERLGYQVVRIAGRIINGSIDKRRPRTHAALIVTVEGTDYLVDVGFGGERPLAPIPLAEATSTHQDGWTYDLIRREDGEWVLRSQHSDGWFELYSFTTDPRPADEYVVFNYYIATYPRSPFVGRPVVQRSGVDARHSLVDWELATVRADGSQTRRTVSESEFVEVLEEVFGIVLTPQEAVALRAALGSSLEHAT